MDAFKGGPKALSLDLTTSQPLPPFDKDTALSSTSQTHARGRSNQSIPSSYSRGKSATILPSVYLSKTKSGSLEFEISSILDEQSIQEFVTQDLSLERIDLIHPYLWLAGLLGRMPSPLHAQLALGRTISVTERMDEHLVWKPGRIFLKPLPRYILDYDFWCEFICPNAVLLESARGFLLSYLWLVQHESDFLIAIESKLIPSDVKWEQWVLFSVSLAFELRPGPDLRVNVRYKYGELRLERLRLIVRFLRQTKNAGVLIRGYGYGSLEHKNVFQRSVMWLVTPTISIVMFLTVMQLSGVPLWTYCWSYLPVSAGSRYAI